MKSFTTITTNIATDLNQWLTKEAKREDVTKRALFEHVLRSFQMAKEREEYAEGFRRMAKDKAFMKEMHELVECDMASYAKQLKKFD